MDNNSGKSISLTRLISLNEISQKMDIINMQDRAFINSKYTSGDSSRLITRFRRKCWWKVKIMSTAFIANRVVRQN